MRCTSASRTPTPTSSRYLNLLAPPAGRAAPASVPPPFRRMCKAEHLHHLRVREWQDLHGQLRHVARTIGIDVDAHAATTGEIDRDRIHQSLLAGLLSHVGMWDPQKREYVGARQARFAIAARSPLSKAKPRWVMAGELVETNRLWARTVARINPAWIERLAPHLVKRSHGDPWWDAQRGAAMTNERVTLYGLPLVASRRAQYGTHRSRRCPGDLPAARAAWTASGTRRHEFLERNRELVDEVRAMEHRVRRGDLLVGDDVLLDFYDERVPSDVTSGRHFDRWWRDEKARRPDLLTFTPELLVVPDTGGVDATSFPATWRQGELVLSLDYAFEPGAVLDGVTVDVPLAVLNSVDAAGFDWQVPGLREELVTALIRSLPKPVRRSFVPAPDFARRVLDRAGPGDGPLLDVLTRELTRMTGDPIPPGSWDLDAVPDHLRMTFRAVDDRGRPVAWSKDLAALRERLRDRVRTAVADAAPSIEQSGLRSWTIGTLPQVVVAERDGHAVKAFPALVDDGDSVAVRAFPTEAEQARHDAGGYPPAGAPRPAVAPVAVATTPAERHEAGPRRRALDRRRGRRGLRGRGGRCPHRRARRPGVGRGRLRRVATDRADEHHRRRPRCPPRRRRDRGRGRVTSRLASTRSSRRRCSPPWPTCRRSSIGSSPPASSPRPASGACPISCATCGPPSAGSTSFPQTPPATAGSWPRSTPSRTTPEPRWCGGCWRSCG